MHEWNFTARDNGGFFQHFTVKARNKQEAIKKGLEKARKKAKGDISTWNCNLASFF